MAMPFDSSWTRHPAALTGCSPSAWRLTAIPMGLWRPHWKQPTASIGSCTCRTAPEGLWWMSYESASRPDQAWSIDAASGSPNSGLKINAAAGFRFLMALGCIGLQPERLSWRQEAEAISTPTPRIHPKPVVKALFSHGKPVRQSTISNLFSSIPRR